MCIYVYKNIYEYIYGSLYIQMYKYANIRSGYINCIFKYSYNVSEHKDEQVHSYSEQ
jgi:hypothetical protein